MTHPSGPAGPGPSGPAGPGPGGPPGPSGPWLADALARLAVCAVVGAVFAALAIQLDRPSWLP